MIKSIHEAAEILDLGEKATLVEINSRYKELLFQWHPDHCKGNREECKARTEKIIESYKVIMNYCYNYRFSFSKEDLEKTGSLTDPEEFWNKKFGHDPLWGYSK